MRSDLGHTISSVSKITLRTKRKIDNEISNKKVKVYELWMDHTYRTYETIPKDGYKSYMFDGVPVKARNFAKIYPSKYKDEIDKPIGDVFSVEISSFILNEKSYKILYPYIKNEVQIFKIKSDNMLFYVVNVTNIIDCLHYEKSELKHFPSSGRIMRVIKYVFKEEKIKDTVIFKLPGIGFVNSHSFVTEEFKKVVEKNNIKGFKFKEL